MTIGNSTTTYAMDFFYDASGYPFAVKYNGDLCYYVTNLQGDVMSIVDAQGEVVAEYEYDPYGNILAATGPLADVNPLRYRGYVFDSESGLYYLQSRYYDPEMGRFINADALVSTGQGVLGNNMFVYCLNNPTCLMDSSGLTPTEAVDTDGDGIVDYYRYEYTYSYVYYENDTIKSVIITGNVYYFPDIGSPKNLDASDYPKGFQPWSDIMVGNYIQVKADHSNPVLYAYQAQHLHVQAYSNAIACMLQIDADFGLGLNRSKTSMMTEWLSHMVLLGKLGLSRTANVDFDRDSEDLRFLDYLKWAIQETLKIGTGK